MGYNTEFCGCFNFDREPNVAACEHLQELASKRHGDDHKAYPGCPSFYCQWEYKYNNFNDSYILQWDGCEKFYEYVDWLKIILRNLKRIDSTLKLNGTVEWRGESMSDIGHITLVDNKMTVKSGQFSVQMHGEQAFTENRSLDEDF